MDWLADLPEGQAVLVALVLPVALLTGLGWLVSGDVFLSMLGAQFSVAAFWSWMAHRDK